MMAEAERIMIVDDDERNTFALGSYLELQGFQITVAKDGADALEKLRAEQTPAVILLDMMMPVMDGFETLAALQKDHALRKIPVLAVTAKAMRGDEEKCLAAGALDYLSKPIDLALLMTKIEAITKK
jgi:CheY-like chemotaxis protein